MKKYIVIVLLSLSLVIGLLFGILTKQDEVYNDDLVDSKQIVSENTLSMMLETESNSGEYQPANQNKWPTEGYIFNETLSKCENGSTLVWNEDKKTISKKGSLPDRCTIYFDKYNPPVVNRFTYTATSSSLTITASATKGTYDISKYYFSIDSGATYKESTSNTYTFSSLSAGTTYTIMVKIKDSSNKESEVYSGTAKTNIISLADYCSSGTNLATCIKTFANQGSSVSKIYYHNGSLTNGISDNSYRYAGASSEVNNYVCINSTETTCSDDSLFRIIGVFGSQVKLIRAKSVGSKQWNSTSSSTWSSASLNTYLNGTYLTSLGTFATNYIATTTWKVGGNSYAKIRDVVAATAYANEITSPAATTTVSKKIGLMYASDYGFGADPAAWATTLYNYGGSVNKTAISSLNWLYLGPIEWLITPVSELRYHTIVAEGNGSLTYRIVTNSYAVRPVFYLNSLVTYKSGTGTSSNPIRLS